MVWPSDKCPPEAAHSASTGGWASLLLTEAAAATLDRCRELEAVTLWNRQGCKVLFMFSRFQSSLIVKYSLIRWRIRR